MKRTVSTIYDDPKQANAALQALLDAGFARSSISLLMSKETRLRHYPEEPHGKPAGMGAGVGAILGSLIGLAVAPPTGLFVTGPLVAMLGGAALGGAGGGLLGALIEIGIPEHHARRYEELLSSGGIFVAVETSSTRQAQKAEEILVSRGSAQAERALHIATHASL